MVSRKAATKGEDTLPKPDIYRETGLRYLGYAGSLGWICRAFLPFQMASMVSVAYVCADIFDKANASAIRGDSESQILMTAADSFVWHFLASFALPGVLIQSVHGLTSRLRPRQTKNRSPIFMLPCLISGFALPFISKPIDSMVDNMMDNFFRNNFRGDFDECECHPIDNKNCGEKGNTKYNWFFEQSRDQHDLELERYREKLKAQREPGTSPSSATSAGMRPSGRDDSNNRKRPDTNQYGGQRGFDDDSNANAGVRPSGQSESSNKNRPDLSPYDPRGLGSETVAQPDRPTADPNTSKARGSTVSDESEDMNGLRNKAVQVDKTTKPPRPPKPE